MKPSFLPLRLAAFTLITVTIPGVVVAGMPYEQDSFSKVQSSRSAHDVRAELDSARASGSLINGDADVRSEDASIGPRGTAGSRFSGRTRQEINIEMLEDQRNNRTVSLGG